MVTQQYDSGMLDSSISEQEQIKEESFIEECENAERNYGLLEQLVDIQKASIPYPDISKGETGIDYPDREAIAWKKSANQKNWDEIARIEKYAGCDRLYCGHLRYHLTEYYFTEDNRLTSFVSPDKTFWLINADDAKYQDKVRAWTNPTKSAGISFSRDISIEQKIVTGVDVKFDSRSELLSSITDAYLRKALIRSKGKEGIQSIIQTIQGKQDSIRTLDKSHSFIVQGCAGSGKTLVLLHRIRYLLYNKYIRLGEYILLIPGAAFKNYILENAEKFGISQRYILSYCDYYKQLLNKRLDSPEHNELVLPPSYLKQVYSKEFIQNAYHETLADIQKSVNLLILICEGGLSDLCAEQKEALDYAILSLKDQAFQAAKEILQPVEKYLDQTLNNYADFTALANELRARIAGQVSLIEQASSSIPDIDIAPDDPRIASEPRLVRLREEISTEENILGKASIFTKKAHERKLQSLNDVYEATLKDVIQALIEEEKSQVMLHTEELQYVFPNISLHNAEEILANVTEVYEKAQSTIISKLQEQEDFDSRFGAKHQQTIDALNHLTEMSYMPEVTSEDYVRELRPNGNLVDYIKSGAYVYRSFGDLIRNPEKAKEFQKLRPLFREQSDAQILSYLNTKLLNMCKRNMRVSVQLEGEDEFEKYKHYWYLSLYTHYLIYGSLGAHYQYVFIDEAQDLSPSELELICKINTTHEGKRLIMPVLNLFGDTNQVISEHCTSNWEQLSFMPEQYCLKENFRNTNQIIAYCNANLPFHMQEVGVDMGEVSVFYSVTEFIESSSSVAKEATIIVRDAQFKQLVQDMIKKSAIAGCTVLTVKDSKGLEFQNIIVIDQGMSSNEKYIAYTRALANLVVIHTLA